MKKKLKALIAMMSLCALGTVGSAFALTRNSATGTGTAGKYDKAIYLYWGGTNTSVELDDCDELTVNTPEYRYLTVAPQSTKSVTGTVNVTFTLAVTSGNYHLEGVTVTVYRADVEITSENIATYATNTYKRGELNKSSDPLVDTFAVTSDTAKHPTTKYYAIAVKWDGSTDTTHPSYELGGSLNIAQSFTA